MTYFKRVILDQLKQPIFFCCFNLSVFTVTVKYKTENCKNTVSFLFIYSCFSVTKNTNTTVKIQYFFHLTVSGAQAASTFYCKKTDIFLTVQHFSICKVNNRR